MQTSAQGITALELEEGVVLRAYRDVAGIWTIGAGLTAASGVVKPKAGMVITKEEAARLLQAALRANYEPAVEVAMSNLHGIDVVRPAQHEFDAGISFHWNTGAIKRASWVKLLLRGVDGPKIRASLRQWNKGGGRVLPALTARRDREADMLLHGVYRQLPATVQPSAIFARWGIALSDAEQDAALGAFAVLGFPVGTRVAAVLKIPVIDFQRTYGLTPDGIIGRATLSTLQRQMDARGKVKATAAITAAPVAATALPAGNSDSVDALVALPHAPAVMFTVAALYGLIQAYRYRDSLAAAVHPLLPRVAAFLRSC